MCNLRDTILAKVAQLAGSSPERQNACGGESAGWSREAVVNLSSLKQEPNTCGSRVDYYGRGGSKTLS